MVRLTDHLDQTIAVYWDVKQQTKPKTILPGPITHLVLSRGYEFDSGLVPYCFLHEPSKLK